MKKILQNFDLLMFTFRMARVRFVQKLKGIMRK